jgi:hypothetical protein
LQADRSNPEMSAVSRPTARGERTWWGTGKTGEEEGSRGKLPIRQFFKPAAAGKVSESYEQRKSTVRAVRPERGVE